MLLREISRPADVLSHQRFESLPFELQIMLMMMMITMMIMMIGVVAF